jgi:hypothetical protein
MTDTDLLKARVLEGAARLDAVVASDWRKDINLTDLDLNNCTKCVLGQTFGRYEEGARALGFKPYADDANESIDLGFMPDDGDDFADDLTAAWIDYLTPKETA